MVKRIVAIVGATIALLVIATHTRPYGPPNSAPNGVAVEIANHCVGYTWSNGISQTGFWTGCDQ